MESSSVTLRDASLFMRRVICYNQGECIQYNFLAGELHKSVKDSLRESNRNVATLHKLCDRLEYFLNRNLGRISQENFRLLKLYFRGRHNVEPRVCVKGNHERDGKYYIVPIVRDKEVNYWSDYPLEENSGFLHVKNHGTYFLCNDIPKQIGTVGSDGYRNARIDTDLAREYYKERRLEPAASRDQDFQYDEAWIKCWKKTSDSLEPQSCYKSAIIIPMTLWNNNLDPSFLKVMSIKANTDLSRSIFGYLCFDHVQENYFNDGIDVDVGYIFADILSLYVITRSIYTDISQTFSKALTSFSHAQPVTEDRP